MFKSVMAVMAALLIAASAQAEVEPAKLVIYRADEASKTQRIRFHANIDNRSIGRLKYTRPVVAMVEPGEYDLTTSLPGADGVKVELQPGATYYVYAKVKRIGQTVTPTLEIVEEQVAVSQKPVIEELI